MTEKSKAEKELVEKIAREFHGKDSSDNPIEPFDELNAEDKYRYIWWASRCLPHIKETLPELAKEAGWKSPEEARELYELGKSVTRMSEADLEDWAKANGYAQLSDVQSLPPQNNKCNLWDLYQKGWLESQQSMRMAGWRKVILTDRELECKNCSKSLDNGGNCEDLNVQDYPCPSQEPKPDESRLLTEEVERILIEMKAYQRIPPKSERNSVREELVRKLILFFEARHQQEKEEIRCIIKLFNKRDCGGVNPEWALSDKDYQSLKDKGLYQGKAEGLQAAKDIIQTIMEEKK